MNNHILCGVDTDSFAICKPDQSLWTPEEKKKFIDYINSKFPPTIYWSDDGEYAKFLVIKSKNYVMVDMKGKRKIKGSALKDQKRSKALLQYTEEFIQLLLDKNNEGLLDLYHVYVKKIMNIEDMTPWTKKLTITDKITRCAGHELLSKEEKKENGIRANESKVWDAIKDTQFQEGNKIYIYFKEDNSYGLVENFDGNYNRTALLKNLWSITNVFSKVVNMDQFPKYANKSNKKLLNSLMESV